MAGGNEPAIEGIRAEREALRPIRKMADVILDTSRYTVHELRDYVRERYDVRAEGRKMVVSVLSFGFKYGVPPEADLVFDLRFLANPNFVPELRRLTGADEPVVQLPEEAAGDRGLPAARDVAGALRAAAARARGPQLPDDRGRLHGRPAPLGDDGERDRRGGQAPGLPGARRTTAT